MKDKGSLHLKVQELCDCFATTDPLKEMLDIKGDADKNEAAFDGKTSTYYVMEEGFNSLPIY